MVIIARSNHGARPAVTCSFLEIAGELERMGITPRASPRSAMTWEMNLAEPLRDIPSMAEKCVDMLHRAVAAFISEDAETAVLIPSEDDWLNNLYDQIYGK